VDPESVDVDQLQLRVEETEKLWEELLSEPLDAERVILLDQGAYQATPASLWRRRFTRGRPTGSRSAPS
jgi:hypothetical protein